MASRRVGVVALAVVDIDSVDAVCVYHGEVDGSGMGMGAVNPWNVAQLHAQTELS